METVFFVIFVVMFILQILGLVYQYLSQMRDLLKKSLWKKLADQQEWLTFHGQVVDSSFKKYLPTVAKINQSYVTGTYRNCQLRLETYNHSQGKSSQIYTRIEISQPLDQKRKALPRVDARFTKTDISKVTV